MNRVTVIVSLLVGLSLVLAGCGTPTLKTSLNF